MRKIVVSNDGDLISFLKSQGIAKNKVKTFVSLSFIYVNGKVVHKLPFMVHKNDVLEIRKKEMPSFFKILFEDSHYLIVDKEAGLLTISTSSFLDEDTLYRRVRGYLNQKNEYCFIVNRIDKETSGIVIFVKNEKLKEKLQSNWNTIVKKRGYIAVVQGCIGQSGVIDNFLYEDKKTFSHSTKIGGKRAITCYVPVRSNRRYTMLDIDIKTGRKNQIRVHMSEMGHPILGDKKYGSKDNPIKRLCLHHYEISFVNPIDHKLMTIKSEVPDEFDDLFC